MGPLEPDIDVLPHEVCVIAECRSSTQKRSQAMANRARVGLLHAPYPGQVSYGSLSPCNMA